MFFTYVCVGNELECSVVCQVKLMCSYCTKFKNVDEVPDPYYGGPEGFEKVSGLYLCYTFVAIDSLRSV